MELNLDNKRFLVTGASSGFGRAIAEALLGEGARVIALARGEEGLKEFQSVQKGDLEVIAADVSRIDQLESLAKKVDYRNLSGAVINAGGPPAKSFMETTLKDWDEAYELLIRWKVKLSQDLVPYFLQNNYGRMVYIESVSVKQGIENLALSNSLRMAVVGFVKSVSSDFADSGLTFNILAPGYHETRAIERLLKKSSEEKKISIDEARESITKAIPAGHMGNPNDLATLACWLLSEKSGYINGQTISVDGGLVKGVFG